MKQNRRLKEKVFKVIAIINSHHTGAYAAQAAYFFVLSTDPDHPAFDDDWYSTRRLTYDGGDGRLVSGISVFGGGDDPIHRDTGRMFRSPARMISDYDS